MPYIDRKFSRELIDNAKEKVNLLKKAVIQEKHANKATKYFAELKEVSKRLKNSSAESFSDNISAWNECIKAASLLSKAIRAWVIEMGGTYLVKPSLIGGAGSVYESMDTAIKRLFDCDTDKPDEVLTYQTNAMDVDANGVFKHMSFDGDDFVCDNIFLDGKSFEEVLSRQNLTPEEQEKKKQTAQELKCSLYEGLCDWLNENGYKANRVAGGQVQVLGNRPDNYGQPLTQAKLDSLESDNTTSLEKYLGERFLMDVGRVSPSL